ncbi:hypothetical protein [Microcoleus sp. EPA2]|uniref:PIN domain-containing protein n=1 Tax=Microcoleus sp. EPA2 TaxID=2841654 RepID=UPI00312B9CDF
MSALLLDTHTFIWFSENAPNLSVALKEQMESADRVYLSIASLWEIAIKIGNCLSNIAGMESFKTLQYEWIRVLQ